jgi:uncharacterized protein with PIN domain
MKFIADSMLGRLAKWLRLLGYDTLYYPHIEDRILLKIAREDNRVLLTRDTRLVKVRGLRNFMLLEDNDPFQQLKRIITAYRLQPEWERSDIAGAPLMNRCTDCNTCLDSVSREEVKAAIPEYVYRTSRKFRKCPGCGKLYWDGTHPGKFKKKLSEVLQSP